MTLPLSLGHLPFFPSGLTWVLAPSTPLDEADNEQDQNKECDGTHEPDEPALGGDVGLVVGVSWERQSTGVGERKWGRWGKARLDYRPSGIQCSGQHAGPLPCC